jgi:hypothetical protein
MTDSPPSAPATAALARASAIPSLDARESVVELLQRRFTDDSLSLDEFERRAAVAYQAKTVAELDALVSDLAPAETIVTVPENGRIITVLSNNERAGAMAVPRHLEIVSIFGNVEMDLTHATFGAGVTDLNVSAVFGNVEITVPSGVRVECEGSAFMGNFDCESTKPAAYTNDEERVVRIMGHAVFSSVEVSVAPPTVLQFPQDSPRRLT